MIFLAYKRCSLFNPWDWAIALITRSRFVHVEVVFDNSCVRESFASSPPKGVRHKWHPNYAGPQWKLLPLPRCHDHNECDAFAWCESRLGDAYDWLGVIGFILPARPERGRWFCSEFAAAMIASTIDWTPLGLKAPSKILSWKSHRRPTSAGGSPPRGNNLKEY